MTAFASNWPELYRVPAGRRLAGALRPPPSKSVTNRLCNLALVAWRPVTLVRPLRAEDTERYFAALAALGFAVVGRDDEVDLTPPAEPPRSAAIHCGESGTLLRLLVAALAALPGDWRLDGAPRLCERPIGPLVDALRSLGARLTYLGAEGRLPLAIAGGELAGGATSVDASQSSQYLSALLMAASRARQAVTIAVHGLVSRPYVELTLELLRRQGGEVAELGDGSFRVEPRALAGGRLEVEADYSAAAYPAAAAALAGGRVRLDGLPRQSRQGDRRFLDLLSRMGAQVEWHGDSVEIARGELHALDDDLADIPDQVPTLAALAPFARGTTRIRNVPHLRLKESDRLRAMASGLLAVGAEVSELPDGLVIPGVWAQRSPKAEPVTVDPHGDHRIAMSLAVVGLRRPGVSIRHPEVVAKSYPRFFDDLERLLQG